MILALQQAFDSGFRNPLKISQIVNEVLGGGFVTLDDRLTPEKAINLAQQFKDFRPNELEKYLLPTVYDFADELSIQRLVKERADPVLDYFRGVTSSEDENQNTKDEKSGDDISEATNSSPTDEEKRAEILKKAGNIKGC